MQEKRIDELVHALQLLINEKRDAKWNEMAKRSEQTYTKQQHPCIPTNQPVFLTYADMTLMLVMSPSKIPASTAAPSDTASSGLTT